MPGVIRPLIGSDSLIPVINRINVRDIYGHAALLALLGIVVGLVLDLAFNFKHYSKFRFKNTAISMSIFIS